MKTHVIAAIAVACLGAGVNAQQQQQTTAPTGAPPVIDRGGNQTVHITGCVARGDAARPAAASGAGQTAAFMLTGARMSNDSPTGTAAQTTEDSRNTPNAAQGTAAPGAAAPAASSPQANTSPARAPQSGSRYVLKADTADLTSHIGHQVEVTGRFDATVTYPHGVVVGTSGSSTASPAPSSNPKSSTATGSEPESVSAPPTVIVESVRMIAATCQANQ